MPKHEHDNDVVAAADDNANANVNAYVDVICHACLPWSLDLPNPNQKTLRFACQNRT